MRPAIWNGPVETSHGLRGGVMKSGMTGGFIVHHQVSGHYDTALADKHIEQCRAVVESRGKLIVFCDWQDMTSYDSESRLKMTDAALEYGSKLINYHVLAGTRLVRMGVSVASVVVPVIRSYGVREAFIAAYDRILKDYGIADR